MKRCRRCIIGHLDHLTDHVVKGLCRRIMLINRSIKEVFARCLQIVLFPLSSEQASGRAEIRNPSRNGNASASNNNNLLLLAQFGHEAFYLDIIFR